MVLELSICVLTTPSWEAEQGWTTRYRGQGWHSSTLLGGKMVGMRIQWDRELKGVLFHIITGLVKETQDHLMRENEEAKAQEPEDRHGGVSEGVGEGADGTVPTRGDTADW